jgi:RsiW-degrading membrane proteinase PrsW (M82 family)
MPIDVLCQCGRWLRMPDASAGTRGQCPVCRRDFDIPFESHVFESHVFESHVQTHPEPTPAPAFSPAVDAPKLKSRREPGARPYRYLVLLIALLPLAWSTYRPIPKIDMEERKIETLEGHPDNIARYNELPANATKAEVFATFPDDRLIGAVLPYDTYLHFGMAIVSAAIFFGLVLLLFPSGSAQVSDLLKVAGFTGTVGIVVLLGFQFLAFHMPFYYGGSIVTLFLDLIWLIGLSYRLADSNYGLVVSALGFMAGVGLCEETCKALPLLWKIRVQGFASWREAMTWGLMSGVGFGVSEGITYSHDYYNGVGGGQIYLIRFASCVALHAIWSAATGINLFRRRANFDGYMHPVNWIQQVIATIIVPMILHGMYDTLLKQSYDWGALVVAFASFGWLAHQIELAKRHMGLRLARED